MAVQGTDHQEDDTVRDKRSPMRDIDSVIAWKT